MNAAPMQVSNRLVPPSGITSGLTDANVPDAHFGADKGVSPLAAALTGGNLIYESSGMMASLPGASFEAFVLDDEMHALIDRTPHGAEMKKETPGNEAIRVAVLGPGQFSGGAQTIAAMQRDCFNRTIADRDALVTRDKKGRAGLAAQRATDLPPGAKARMRAAFPIGPEDPA